MRRTGGCRLGVLALLAAVAANAQAQPSDHTLMRYPTLHGDTIVFVAHDNLWSVPRSGGVASRLTTDPGNDVLPRFSPDGKWIAFTGEYQGNRDVYIIPAAGGPVRRLTFTSDVVPAAPLRWGPDNMVVTWTPDSKNIVFLSRRSSWNAWYGNLFEVPATGGLPVELPLDRGGFLSYGPNGHQIAYNRIMRNFRTWKRYTGGLAQNIDLYDFDTHKLERVTDWPGTETFPMWYGKSIYFLSDHGADQRENIWVYDTDTRAFRQITHFTDYDIDFPSLGTGGSEGAGIVFQQGGNLYVLDVPSGALHRLSVIVPDDGSRTGPQWVNAGKLLRDRDMAQDVDFSIAPNGARGAFSARGDIFTLPAEHGDTRDLTDTSNADEDHPTWSPDGRTLAYTTDASGEQQIALRPAQGGPETQLTHFQKGYFYTPKWSPDGRYLAFSDGEHQLWYEPAAGGAPQLVAQDRYNEIHDYTWSPDGLWLAYSVTGENQQSNIWLYSLKTHHATRISDPLSNDFMPAFDRAGKYLFFVSTRHENPTLSQSEFNIATLKMTGIYVATLRSDEPSPFAPRSDEGAVAGAAAGASAEPPTRGKAAHGKGASGGKAGGEEWKPTATAPVRIELDGLMRRAVPLPIAPANIAALTVRGDKVFYMTTPPQMIEGPMPGEQAALRVFDLGKRKDEKVVEGLSAYALSADGKKVLYELKDAYYIADAAPGEAAEKSRKQLDLGHMRRRTLPMQEWAEMFENAWRLERDLFVNSAMNGVDWNAVHARYAKLLPLVGSRSDLNYLIGEMIGELSNSHTYVGGGDDIPPDQRVPTAFLGADFSLDRASGRYRLARIYHGDNTREQYRSPLTAPGLNVHTGDYLLAIDGVELRAPTDPYSLLVGKQAQTIQLTIASSADGKRRTVTVKPVTTELSLREHAWIQHNRDVVDRLSGGKIAYIYLSDMEALGMEQFIRQFYGQLDKRALIIDDRFNGGGFIDQIVLERLRRVLVGLSTDREWARMPIPQQLIAGPKVCLLNHYSASDGDIFPYFFRKYGLGPLIGTRSWGGVRGIRGEWMLLDGGYITIPEDALYGLHSQWIIENHGVAPDQEVDTSPGELLAGHDAQLEAAVSYLMGQLKQHPGELPPPPARVPAYPPGPG
ncbi:MAG TPA: PDZ domain-containing protein [Steroidobacteraceae bacterium]|nr:PDZ domain-containing protein [Steroidobacteraceae bacterium]